MPKKNDISSQLFDLDLFSKSKTALLELLADRLKRPNSTTIVFTPNPEQVVQAFQTRSFMTKLQQADLLLPDGVGLIWASRVLSWFGKAQPLAERITGREVAAWLIKEASRQNQSVLLVGGQGYTPSEVAQLGEHVTWLEGHIDVSKPTKGEDEQITATIKRIKPAVVLVAFGAPHQEEWLLRHRATLEKNGARVAMVIGGAADYIVGRVPETPSIIERLGFEWLFRLVTQPWRWRRQLRLVVFVWLVVRELLFVSSGAHSK